MDLSSKVTLYDFLSMVIPGFLLLILFSLWFNINTINEINEIYDAILLSIISYIVGLVYHKTVEYLFNRMNLRNNEKDLEESAKRFYNDYKKCSKKSKFQHDKHSIQKYYEAYYKLMKENMLNNIPILEAQVAFIRNILPITLLYSFTVRFFRINFYINYCGLSLLLLLTVLVLVAVFFSVQSKIYYLVWEGNEYLKHLITEKNER